MKHLLHALFSLFIFILIINDIKCEFEDDSECLHDDGKNLTNDNCIGERNNTNTLCCLASGYKLVEKLYACVKLNPYQNTSDGRMAKIDELTNDATGVYLDCGQKRVLENTCDPSDPEPRDARDCIKHHNQTSKCCYIEINFNDDSKDHLKGCHSFKDININTIGEAVVAAKTRNVTLKVECSCLFFQIRMIVLVLVILLIIF